MPSHASTGGTSGRERRTDIQALRAVAVTSVLLYHLWPNRLPGGFTGVDVFFVISGFLIAGHMLGEIERTGRLRVGAFWARRAKRLLPAALLTLVVTAAATAVWVPRGLWSQFYDEILAATFYVQNWRLASDSIDYLAASNEPSAVQHYWSLSAEEQFYVLLPLVMLLCLGVARVLRRPPRVLVGVALAVLTVTSFVHAMLLTEANPGVAYFSTFTRGWEFTAGALLALVPPRLGRAARVGLVTAGLALVAGSVLLVDGDLPFPGPWAAVAVVGTVLAIAAGHGTYLDRVGAWRPVALVGAVSFAIYLWHFPLIVILPYVTGRDLTTTDKLLIGVASLVLAYLSTRFVEDPVRFSPRLLGARPPRVVAVVAACAMVLTATTALAPRALHERQAEQEAQRLEAALAGDVPCLGAESLDPLRAPCDNPDLRDVVLPEPSVRAKDDANRVDCWSRGEDASVKSCVLGPERGATKRLLAIGDSHSNTLLGVYEDMAEANGWRITVAGRMGCWWTHSDVPDLPGLDGTCAQWRRGVQQLVESQGGVDAIIVTNRAFSRSSSQPAEQRLPELSDGLVRAWSSRPSADVPVIAIEDNPVIDQRTMACIDETPTDELARCDVPRERALDADSGLREAVEQTPNAHLIDLTDLYCDDATCPVVVGGVLVYRDASHITKTYAATLAPYIQQGVERVLEEAGR